MSTLIYNLVKKSFHSNEKILTKFEEAEYLCSFEEEIFACVAENLGENSPEKNFLRGILYLDSSEEETPLFKRCLERAASQGFLPAANLIMNLRSLGIYDSYALTRAHLVHGWRP